MISMKKWLFLLVFLVSFTCLGKGVFAAENNEEMIRELEAQIVAIQARIKVLRSGVATTSSSEVKKEIMPMRDYDWQSYKLEKDLRLGISGEDVEILQEVFATDVSFYPERVATGYFGSLTGEAIKRFQKKNGLSVDAVVSGNTKEKLNSFLKEKGVKVSVVNGVKKYCISSVRPAVDIKKSGLTVKVSLCPGAVLEEKKAPSSVVKPTVMNGSFSLSEHNDLSPEFYYVDAFDVTGASAKIVVGVTEKVQAKLWYATTGNLSLSPIVRSSAEWLKIHSFNLTDLLPGTTYNIYVVVVDGDGNYATSSIKTFKTTQSSDTTAPIISQVRISDIGTSSVLVSWKTSETSKKKIYYAPTLGFALDKALVARSELYTVAHGLRLEKLTAGTGYSFVIESEDVKANKGKSEVWTFTTPVDDRRPPVFISVVSAPLSATTAMVTVKSDEASRAMIHFGTSEPLDLGSSYYRADAVLSTNHTFSLNDLVPRTNYRFVISLKDALGNISTSSIGTFRTY